MCRLCLTPRLRHCLLLAFLDCGLCLLRAHLYRLLLAPLPADRRSASHEYFLGSGGVLGLLGSLVGRAMRGSGQAVAEANALHKGPVVFHIPQASSRGVCLPAGWTPPRSSLQQTMTSQMPRQSVGLEEWFLICDHGMHRTRYLPAHPQPVIRCIRQRATAGDHDFAQLELDLFRWVGGCCEGCHVCRQYAVRCGHLLPLQWGHLLPAA